MKFIKQNIVILLAFILPILLITGVALSVYIPSLFLSTKYNFVYTTCAKGIDSEYPFKCINYTQKRYSVVNNKMIINNIDPTLDSDNNKIPDIYDSDFSNDTIRIILHDTEKNESREITFEEAQTLTLNNFETSPDGVAIKGDWSGGSDFFMFGGSSSTYGYYLTKGKIKNKLNLIYDYDQYYYREGLQFIGWVLPGRN
jgi:hypothetical protein